MNRQEEQREGMRGDEQTNRGETSIFKKTSPAILFMVSEILHVAARQISQAINFFAQLRIRAGGKWPKWDFQIRNACARCVARIARVSSFFREYWQGALAGQPTQKTTPVLTQLPLDDGSQCFRFFSNQDSM